MPVAIRGGTPAVFTSLSPTVGGVLNGARQPQAGDVLILIHCNDYYTAAAMSVPTAGGTPVIAIGGAGLPADGGQFFAHAKPYRFDVAVTGDLAVSVTENAPGAEEKALIALVLSGVQPGAAIDVAAGFFDSTQVPPTANNVCPSVTIPAALDDFLIVHANDGGGASSGPVVNNPAGMTNIYDTVFGGMALCGAVQQLAANGPTGTRTFVKTAAGRFYASLTIAVRTASVAPVTGTIDDMAISQGAPMWELAQADDGERAEQGSADWEITI